MRTLTKLTTHFFAVAVAAIIGLASVASAQMFGPSGYGYLDVGYGANINEVDTFGAPIVSGGVGAEFGGYFGGLAAQSTITPSEKTISGVDLELTSRFIGLEGGTVLDLNPVQLRTSLLAGYTHIGLEGSANGFSASDSAGGFSLGSRLTIGADLGDGLNAHVGFAAKRNFGDIESVDVAGTVGLGYNF